MGKVTKVSKAFQRFRAIDRNLLRAPRDKTHHIRRSYSQRYDGGNSIFEASVDYHDLRKIKIEILFSAQCPRLSDVHKAPFTESLFIVRLVKNLNFGQQVNKGTRHHRS